MTYTPDELKKRELDARQEWPMVSEAFDRVRNAAMQNLFATKATEHEKREEIYRLVQLLNRVQTEMLSFCGQGSDDIQKFIDGLAPQPSDNRQPQ